MHEHAHTHEHVHGPDCGHDHVHDHKHEHQHNDELVEQLLTVGICGVFGAVATIAGYEALAHGTGVLKVTLNPDFWPWVFGGGIALLVLSVIRGIVLFRNSGAACCNHSHETGDHSHGSVFWRAVVLMFPLALFFMGLPNSGFSQDRINKLLGNDAALDLGSLKEVQAKSGNLALSFDDVANALRNPDILNTLSGSRATLRGQLKKINDREFTLYTLKMTCCASDTVPLKARIVLVADDYGSSLNSRGYSDGDWIAVTGVLQFVNVPTSKEPLPVVRAKLSDIETTTPDL